MQQSSQPDLWLLIEKKCPSRFQSFIERYEGFTGVSEIKVEITVPLSSGGRIEGCRACRLVCLINYIIVNLHSVSFSVPWLSGEAFSV